MWSQVCFDPELLPYDFVEAFCTMMFASLPRSDQRRWAEVYVRGLLSTDGRKTMRRIASVEDGAAVEQSLQQFVSKSPWEWQDVRSVLGRHLDRALPLQAFVVQPLTIPKAGDHTVGVERQFVKSAGRVVNCQRAVSIWLAMEGASCPVDWELALPSRWIRNPQLRKRAGIPEGTPTLTAEEHMLDSVRRISKEWGIRPRPVVVDSREPDPGRVIYELSKMNIPFVLRTSSAVPVSPVAPRSFPGMGRRIAAGRLIHWLRDQRRSVEWKTDGSSARRSAFAVSTAVHTPLDSRSARAGRNGPLTLMAVWSESRRPPTEFWLSNMTYVPLHELFQLTRLSDRAAKDMANVSIPLGIRDFEGRSFRGWHHHVTLTSVAHAIWTLATSRGCVAAASDDGRTARNGQSFLQAG